MKKPPIVTYKKTRKHIVEHETLGEIEITLEPVTKCNQLKKCPPAIAKNALQDRFTAKNKSKNQAYNESFKY